MNRLLALLAFANLGVTCGPGPSGPPEPDTCNTPQTRTLASVEIGAGDEDTFMPFVDDQIVSLVIGPQGGAMLPVRLRITGSSLPECLAQATSIRLGAEEIAISNDSLKTYAEVDGSRTTKSNFVILFGEPDDGAELIVTTMSGGQTTSRRLHVNMINLMPVDAGPPPVDAPDPIPPPFDAAGP